LGFAGQPTSAEWRYSAANLDCLTLLSEILEQRQKGSELAISRSRSVPERLVSLGPPIYVVMAGWRY